MCPKCESEYILANGDHTNECEDCGYRFHESEGDFKLIGYEIRLGARYRTWMDFTDGLAEAKKNQKNFSR